MICKFVSVIIARMFWYWNFENRSLRAGGKSNGVEMIDATGSTNGGAEGKRRIRGNRGWRWCCGLENSE